MIDELLSYYVAELAFIREMGAEFAAKYPKVAARLSLEADKCEDPHVERLLEGFAFLTARIRRKIDDEFPEITDALLGVLYPHFQRPLPSMSVVQFVLAADQVKATTGYTLKKESRLTSRPVSGLPCRFLTAYPTTLWPIEVTAARLDPDRVNVDGKPAGAVALLSLTLKTSGGLPFSSLNLRSLRFYLDGTGTLPYALHELIFNDVRRVTVRGPSGDLRTEAVTLPDDAIGAVGYGRDEGMFPYPTRSFPGYRLIQEFFAFPEKFLFFDLSGLDRLAGRGFGDTIEVLFFLGRSPKGVVGVQPENFRLNCTPIVNLFPQVCEPIAKSDAKFEYRVVPDVHHQLATEVYSVNSVVGDEGLRGDPLHYEPFYSMRHGGRDRRPAYWHATRRPSQKKDDAGSEVYLSFVNPDFNPRAPASQMVTVRATCTNRDLPSRLPFGGEQGDFEAEADAPVGRVRCLRKPTRPLRPPLGRGAQWRLISLLSLNHLSLADSAEGLDALREILALYDFADSAASRQMISGVTGVSVERVARRPPRVLDARRRAIGNVLCLGLEVTVEFDESQFVGSGAFLLASVLDRFFGLYASINSFSQLVARTRQREGILKTWPPRAGDRSLL